MPDLAVIDDPAPYGAPGGRLGSSPVEADEPLWHNSLAGLFLQPDGGRMY